MNGLFSNIRLSDVRYIKPPKRAGVIFIVVCIWSFICFTLELLINGQNTLILNNVFFMGLRDFIADFFNVVGYCGHNDPYNCLAYSGLEEKAYPPMNYVLLHPFSKLVDIDKYYKNNYFLDMAHDPHIMLAYMILVVISAGMIYTLVISKLRGRTAYKAGVSFAVVLSMPVLFAIERGNTITAAVIALIVFVFFYDSKNVFIKEIALLSLAFSFSLKLAPAVFGVLLLLDKQYKEAIRTAIYGLLMFFFPFLLIEGHFNNISYLLRNLSLMNDKYALQGTCTLYNCFSSCGLNGLSILCKTPFKYVISLFLLVCCIFYRRKWETATALALVAIITPSFSQTYTLLYFIPALILFLNEKNKRKADWLALYSFLTIFPVTMEWIPFGISRFFYHSWGIIFLLGMIIAFGVQEITKRIKEYSAVTGKQESIPMRIFTFLSMSSKKMLPVLKVLLVILLVCCIISLLSIAAAVAVSVDRNVTTPFESVLFGDIVPNLELVADELSDLFSFLIYILVVFSIVYLFVIPVIKHRENKKNKTDCEVTETTEAPSQIANKTNVKRLAVLIGILGIVIAASVVLKQNPDMPKEISRRCGIELYKRGEYEAAADYLFNVTDYSDCQYYLELCYEHLNNDED